MSDDTSIDGVNYGPLAILVGNWRGDEGMDDAPEPDGSEHSPFYETMSFEAAGDVTNAEEQLLAVVRYHRVVTRKSNDKVFHDQVGYWLWDASDNTIVESFSIPRGVAVLAGGRAEQPESVTAEVVLDVKAEAGAADWGIVQTPFMLDKAKTTAFTHNPQGSGRQHELCTDDLPGYLWASIRTYRPEYACASVANESHPPACSASKTVSIRFHPNALHSRWTLRTFFH